MIYHHLCGKSKMAKAASDHDKNTVKKKITEVVGVRAVSVEERQDAVVPEKNANPKKTFVTKTKMPIGTIMAEVEGVRGVFVEGRQDAVLPTENANQKKIVLTTTKMPSRKTNRGRSCRVETIHL